MILHFYKHLIDDIYKWKNYKLNSNACSQELKQKHLISESEASTVQCTVDFFSFFSS